MTTRLEFTRQTRLGCTARIRAFLIAVAFVPIFLAGRARPTLAQESGDARWTAIASALGRTGETEDGYYRVTFPRRDLTVRIGDHTLEPAFELTTYFAFVPTRAGQALCMGELVLLQDEVNGVLEEARRQGVEIPALHNHLIGEEPRILYVHVMASGPASTLGARLRALVARTATPTGPAQESGGAEASQKAAWAPVSASLGEPEEVEGQTAEWTFPRLEPITEAGVAVRSSGALETASEVVFQQLSGGQAATTGEAFLSPDEVTPVTHALEAGGIHVTAIHTHMLHETPRLYWLHWYGRGDPGTLARTIRTALGHTRSRMPGARQ